MQTLSLALLSLPLSVVRAQDVHVPPTCTGNFSAGSDTVLLTLPYTYNSVMTIISNFQNLTWSGNPPDTVRLNGTNNTPGTARSYSLQGIPTVETLVTYSRPPCPGPYVEVHNTARVDYTAFDVSAYMPFDGTSVTSDCLGKASVINMTTHFCSTNVPLAQKLLHQVHLADAMEVGKMLGGGTFQGCTAMYVQPFAPVCPFGVPLEGDQGETFPFN